MRLVMVRNRSRSSAREPATTSKVTTVVARRGLAQDRQLVRCLRRTAAAPARPPPWTPRPGRRGRRCPEPVEAAARESPPRVPLAAATVPVRAPNWSRRRLEICELSRPLDPCAAASPAVHACPAAGPAGRRRRCALLSPCRRLKIGPLSLGAPGSSSRSGTTESCSSKPLELTVEVFTLGCGERLQRRPATVRLLKSLESGRHFVEALAQRRQQAWFSLAGEAERWPPVPAVSPGRWPMRWPGWCCSLRQSGRLARTGGCSRGSRECAVTGRSPASTSGGTA